jgi:hypothetical protein
MHNVQLNGESTYILGKKIYYFKIYIFYFFGCNFSFISPGV